MADRAAHATRLALAADSLVDRAPAGCRQALRLDCVRLRGGSDRRLLALRLLRGWRMAGYALPAAGAADHPGAERRDAAAPVRACPGQRRPGRQSCRGRRARGLVAWHAAHRRDVPAARTRTAVSGSRGVRARSAAGLGAHLHEAAQRQHPLLRRGANRTLGRARPRLARPRGRHRAQLRRRALSRRRARRGARAQSAIRLERPRDTGRLDPVATIQGTRVYAIRP